MSDADITRLLAMGITPDEIWCAIDAPEPWTLTLEDHCDAPGRFVLA